jgi:hypothetical protein
MKKRLARARPGEANVRSAIRGGGAHRSSIEPVLLQGRQRGPEIDVIGLAVDDEGWHRLHACGFSFGDSALDLSEVYDLDLILSRIELIRELPFGVGANRTSGMVENRFPCHSVNSFSIAQSWN